MFHDYQQGARNMPLDRNGRNAQVLGYFGVTVAGTMRKVDFTRAWIDGVQESANLFQLLPGFQQLLRRRVR
jgi:hypothetical protein